MATQPPVPSDPFARMRNADRIICFGDRINGENQGSHITYILFKAGGEFFQSPEYRFASAAPGLLVAPTEVHLGGRLRNVFVLDHIERMDFFSLLNYFYPQGTSATSPSKAELISVLKIATQYKAKSLRAEAIDQLERLDLSWLDRAWLGRECFVAKWFRSGYFDMIKSEAEDCTSDEAIEKLSLAMVVRACRAKESLYPVPPTPAKKKPIARTTSECLAHKISSEVFQEDLDNLPSNASNPVEEFWVALMFAQRDRLDILIPLISKRPESLTCDEVKGHEHQFDLVGKMLLSRLRFKAENGQPSKDVHSAFEGEFGEELMDISRRDQELGSQQLCEVASLSESMTSGNWNEAAKTLPLIFCYFLLPFSVMVVLPVNP